MTAPHSRWRLLKEMERLARSHDRAKKALARSAALGDRRPCEWLTWWVLPPMLTVIFLGWTSLDTLRTMTAGTVPSLVAPLPGVALAVALAGTVVLAADAFRNSPQSSIALWAAVPALVCVIGATVWVGLWLEGAVRTARPIAFAAGVLMILVVTASTFGATLFGPRRPSTAGREGGRRTLAGRRADRAVRSHLRTWAMTAHQAGVLLGEAPEARGVLLRLIDGTSSAALPGDLDPVHALVLTGLRDHHPDRLAVQADRQST